MPYHSFGNQVNGWVDHSAQQVIPGQQPPAAPGGAPPVPLPPQVAPPMAAPATTQFPLQQQGEQVGQENPAKLEHQQNVAEHWQDRLANMQQVNPEQYARRLPMVQQMMQRRGFQFTPPQALPHTAIAPQTSMPLNPNPPIV